MGYSSAQIEINKDFEREFDAVEPSVPIQSSAGERRPGGVGACPSPLVPPSGLFLFTKTTEVVMQAVDRAPREMRVYTVAMYNSDGIVMRFDDTVAVSAKQAINNIRWRLFGGSAASKRYAANWTARAA